MSDDERLQDSEGNVYKKTYYGSYERDWSFLKQDYVQEDKRRNEWNPTAHSEDGKPLYKVREPAQSNNSRTVRSGGGNDAAAGFAILLLVFAALAFSCAAVAAIILPLFTVSFRRLHSSSLTRKKLIVFLAGWIVVLLPLTVLSGKGSTQMYNIATIAFIGLAFAWVSLFWFVYRRDGFKATTQPLGAASPNFFSEYRASVNKVFSWFRNLI